MCKLYSFLAFNLSGGAFECVLQTAGDRNQSSWRSQVGELSLLSSPRSEKWVPGHFNYHENRSLIWISMDFVTGYWTLFPQQLTVRLSYKLRWPEHRLRGEGGMKNRSNKHCKKYYIWPPNQCKKYNFRNVYNFIPKNCISCFLRNWSAVLFRFCCLMVQLCQRIWILPCKFYFPFQKTIHISLVAYFSNIFP